MCVHDRSPPGGGRHFIVHKFIKANCITAQLHQDVIQVIQQLVAIGKLFQNSSYANKKNKKQKVTGEGKGTCNELLNYWCRTH